MIAHALTHWIDSQLVGGRPGGGSALTSREAAEAVGRQVGGVSYSTLRRVLAGHSWPTLAMLSDAEESRSGMFLAALCSPEPCAWCGNVSESGTMASP
ncbi:hypothetical protein CTZ27_17850 [Streptomyces griseocarneus]|nr:hypothetical protein CTZ27_17850 [Streptomyces griseocarneus]